MDPLTLAMMGGTALQGIGGLLGSGTQQRAAGAAGQMGWLGSIMAAQAQEQGYQRAQQALSPYTSAGSKSLDMLMSYLQGTGAKQAGIGGGGANLMSTFAPTMAQLEQTPGYQFTLAQGTKAAQNAAAGRGLGSSGNAMQAGVDYATGLAGTTFQQQLQNYLTQNQQAYNMLYGPSTLGAQAAGGIANAAMGAAGNIGNALTGAGTALGQGIMGGGNAAAGGIQSAFGSAGNALQMPYYATNFGTNRTGAARGAMLGMPEILQYGFSSSGNLPSNVVGGLGDRAVPTFY